MNSEAGGTPITSGDDSQRRQPGRVLLVAAVVALVGIAAIIGVLVTRSDSSESTPRAAPAWTRQVVHTDLDTVMDVPVAAHGDQTVLLGIGSDGTVTSFSARGDGAFERGTPLATGIDGLGYAGVWLTHRGDGWFGLALGGPRPDSDAYIAVALRSTDGMTWTKQMGTGPPRVAWISGFTATDDHVVLAGHHQHDGTSTQSNAFGAAWWSVDGTDWHEVELPVPPGLTRLQPGQEGGDAGAAATALTTVQDTIIAVGLATGASTRANPEPTTQAVTWRSTDGGKTWTVAPSGPGDGGIRVASLATVGDTVLASGVTAVGGVQPVPGDGRQVVVRSVDRGRTWQRIPVDAIERGASGGLDQLIAGGGRFFAISTNALAERSDAACDEGFTRCDQTTSRIFTSTDGTRWWIVNRPENVAPGEFNGDALAATDTGRVSSFVTAENGFSVQSWPTGRQLPTVPPPTSAAPTTDLGPPTTS